jgi:hypothetical protein
MNKGIFDEKYETTVNMNQMTDFFRMKNNINKEENIYEDLGHDKGDISVCFRYFKENGSHSIAIICSFNEKVSNVIKKYRIKSGDYDTTEKFIFDARNLNQSLTVYEAGLQNHSKIFVASTMETKGGGGYGIYFSDVNKNKTREITCSKKAPSYRAVTKGINIFGICNFKKCEAYKKEVVVMINKKKFDLINERNELFCPECGSPIIPKTVGFYLCKFKIYGKKINDGKEEYFENKIDEANNKNSVKYFDPDLNGEVMITQLIFEVIEYF